MRTTTWLIDWASCWTASGVTPDGGAVELPEDIPLPASSAKRTASPADSRRYRMALPLFTWAGMGPIIARRPPMSRRTPSQCKMKPLACHATVGDQPVLDDGAFACQYGGQLSSTRTATSGYTTITIDRPSALARSPECSNETGKISVLGYD